MATRARPRSSRRWLRRSGLVLFALVLGVLTLVASALGALQTPWGRERVRLLVNDALAEVFQGKIVIERIGGVGLSGVSGVDARVFDPAGKQVIALYDLRALAALPSLAYQLVASSARPELLIPLVRIEHAEVALRDDAELGVTLASTFLPRETEAEAEPPADPADGPRLTIGSIVIEHVWAHGTAGGSPPLDAELSALRASMRQSPVDGFILELERVELLSRGLPLALDPRGRASGRVEVPAEGAGPMRLEVALDGHAAESPLALEASWVGDALHANLALARLPAEFLNRQAPGLALDGDVTLVADIDGELPELAFDVEVDATGAHVRAQGYGVVAEGRELLVSVAAARVDLSRLVEGAPPSDLRAAIEAALFEGDDGQLVGSQRVVVDAGLVANEATPAAWLTGAVRLDEDAVALTGHLGADEPGVSLNGGYSLELPPSGSGSGSASASLQARLDDPARLQRFGVRATGTLAAAGTLALEAGTVSARASASLSRVEQGVLTARNVELQAQASGTLEQLRVKAATTLEALAGRARAELEYAPERQRLSVSTADLDLLQLAQLLEVKVPLKQGTLQLDAAIERAPAAAPWRLNALAKADFGKIGAVDLEARDFEVPTTAPTLATLSRLRGDLSARGKVELAEVSPYLAAAELPIDRLDGKLRFEVTAKRREDAQGLELGVRLDTNALAVIEKRKTPAELTTTGDAIASSPMALEGIDVHVALRSELESGLAEGTVILRDRGGTLADIQAEARIAEVWPARLTDAAALAQMPLRATLRVPERRLRSLPPLLRPAALRGRAGLFATLEGSVAAPRIEASIEARSLRAAGARDPIDVDARVQYDPAGGKVEVGAARPRGAGEVARLTSEWRGDLRRAGELATGRSGITASAAIKLRDFPLDVVPALVDQQVTGQLSGDLELRDWGRDARIFAKLSSRSLRLGKMPVQQLSIDAETDARNARAEVAMKVGAGVSRAMLDAGMTWGRRPLPELEHRGTVKLETRAFQLETLSPLLGAYVSEIGGVLDASTQVTVTPDRTRLAGQAKLERGVVQLPAIGQRFSDIVARLSVENDEFKLDQLDARGTTGRLRVKGRARLDGFALRSAVANVTIAKNEAIPVTVEGSAIGDAWGNVQATYSSPERGAKRLDIAVQRFHLLTPETGGQGLQSLDEPEGIRVGVRRADGAFVPLPVQPLEPGGVEEETSSEPAEPLLIVVKLGRDVVVERGRTAKAQLAGQLEIESARETSIKGRIEVRGGQLDVSGKRFDIERGVVTFDGRDPGNPTITATARWDAPGYTVYAEYLGDVENGRIKLRSEPPLSQDEIASLLLFGSPDGSLGSGSSDNAALAVSVAGETAAKGLNQVLDDFTNLDVSARVDTTTGNARPELVLQVTPRLAAKVTRAVGAPTANEAPDRTFLTLELRLKRAWALSAVVGDHGGSALDLIWRKRY